MDDEQKRWSAQYTANIGVREFLRLFCAIMLWILIGVGTSIAFDLAGYSFGSIIISIFIIMMFVFPFFAVSRKPTYLLLRKILGNESLPKEPYPRSKNKMPHEPRPWWSYLPGLWFTLMTLIAMYFAIKYLLK